MRKYLLPFLFYLLTIPLLQLVVPTDIARLVRFFIVALLLVYYWPQYKLRWRFDVTAAFAGFVIFILWVALKDFVYGSPGYYTLSWFFMSVKIAAMVSVAPLIEELFTRQFLMRILISHRYEKVPLGTFTWLSFIVTVLFFGFSHEYWLAGIVTGIILNLLLYYTRNIESCIGAHIIANVLLAGYVVLTDSWLLW